mgnify:CR=1 FL=1
MSQQCIEMVASGTAPLAVVIITKVLGSAPRHEGTMMVFRPDGSSTGTVGGGLVELRAAEEAAKSLAGRRSSCVAVEMLGAQALGSDPICGGAVEFVVDFVADTTLYSAAATELAAGRDVFIKYAPVSPGGQIDGQLSVAVLGAGGAVLAGTSAGRPDADTIAAANAAADAARRDVIHGTTGGAGQTASGQMAAGRHSGAGSLFRAASGAPWLRVRPMDELYVFGGGHVGRALALFAAELGFVVTLVDTRPAFADADAYPEGIKVVQGDYAAIAKALPVRGSTYIVVATPNHISDLETVAAVLGRGYRYAGFVASRRKTTLILDQLKKDGFDPAEVDALRAPIGVDIGAETPAEIAVTICAELIAARHASPALATFDRDRARRRA